MRKLGTFERLDADTEALVAHRTAVELISFVMDKAAQVLDSEYGGRKGMSDGADGADGAADKAPVDRRGAELFKCVATMIAHTSQGLECQVSTLPQSLSQPPLVQLTLSQDGRLQGVNNELWQCVLAYQALMQNDQEKDEPLKALVIPRLLTRSARARTRARLYCAGVAGVAQWDPLQLEHTVFTLRPYVRRIGAVPPLLALAHPEVEQAIRTTPMADAVDKRPVALGCARRGAAGAGLCAGLISAVSGAGCGRIARKGRSWRWSSTSRRAGRRSRRRTAR